MVLITRASGTRRRSGREVVLHGHDMSPWAEAALYAPRDGHVIQQTGLFPHRTVAENIATVPRLLGWDRERTEKRVRELNLMVTDGLLPDCTFLVLLDPDEARRRAARDPDRIEREGEEFWRRADEGFRALAAEFPERIVSLDGAASPDAIAEEVREHVLALL
jgi:hypothetical protein